MAFRREIIPAELESGDRLTGRMAGIGMNFAVTPMPDANIEDTLLAASHEGVELDDLRVLAILTTWFGVHHPRINADRLIRLVAEHDSARVRAFWSALSRWKSSDFPPYAPRESASRQEQTRSARRTRPRSANILAFDSALGQRSG